MGKARDAMTFCEGRTLEVRYEDLLANPRETVRQMAAYCCLEPNDGKIAGLLNGIQCDRAYAYQKESGLLSLARRHLTTLSQFGY